jgi:hypothetical protein
MVKSLITMITATIIMSQTKLESLEFIVSTIEKLAWGLEKLAERLEE